MKRKRKYSVDKLTASAHPLRLTLLDLIKQGINTAPKMAEVLKENRMNLYHHLNYLEKAGFISSFYEEDRVKKYQMKSEITERVDQNTMTDTHSLILNPTSENEKKFQDIVDQLLEINGVVRDYNAKVSQVHVILKSARANVLLQQNIDHVQRLKNIKNDKKNRKV